MSNASRPTTYLSLYFQSAFALFPLVILFTAIAWLPDGPQRPGVKFGLESGVIAFFINTLLITAIFTGAALFFRSLFVAFMDKLAAARRIRTWSGKMKWAALNYIFAFVFLGILTTIKLYINGVEDEFGGIESLDIFLIVVFVPLFVTPFFMFWNGRELREEEDATGKEEKSTKPVFFERFGFQAGRYLRGLFRKEKL